MTSELQSDSRPEAAVLTEESGEAVAVQHGYEENLRRALIGHERIEVEVAARQAAERKAASA